MLCCRIDQFRIPYFETSSFKNKLEYLFLTSFKLQVYETQNFIVISLLVLFFFNNTLEIILFWHSLVLMGFTYRSVFYWIIEEEQICK